MADEENPPPPPQVNHVAVKPPLFDEGSVSRWFSILESQFAIARITQSQTKFHHVLSNIPMTILNQIPEVVITGQSYDQIKAATIALFDKSKPEIFDALMAKNRVLCTKPSVFLVELRKLATQLQVTDDFLKVKFITSLPPSIRPSIVSHESESLEAIAKIADTLIAYQNSSNGSPSTSVSAIDSNFRNVNMNHSRNNKQYNSSYNNPTHHNHVNSHPEHNVQARGNINLSDSNIPLPIRSFHRNQKPKVCRFHLYYGSKAKYCKPWCMNSTSTSVMLPNSLPSSRSNSPIRHNQPEN